MSAQTKYQMTRREAERQIKRMMRGINGQMTPTLLQRLEDLLFRIRHGGTAQASLFKGDN